MPRNVTWHDLAIRDLTEAYLHIAAGNPLAAERLIDAVEDAIQLLRVSPSAGRLRGFDSPRLQALRSWSVKGFPDYLLFYLGFEQGIEVVRFIHGARDIPTLIGDEG